MEMTSQGWGYLYDKSSKERKMILETYAEKYIVPMFIKYPELKGRVYLALRKAGFFANHTPVYHIIVPENVMKDYSEYQLRILTAHELLHLIQYDYGIGVNEGNLLKFEQQATFMSFARGYSYDFIKAFPTCCNKEICDMKDRHCYYKCKSIFSKPCKEYTDDELKEISKKLNELANQYTMIDFPNYINIIEERLLK